jgi:hypothetical protein
MGPFDKCGVDSHAVWGSFAIKSGGMVSVNIGAFVVLIIWLAVAP